MANILIRELDSTAYLNRSITNDNLVLVSGRMGSGTTSGSLNEFTICRSLKEFYAKFGSAPAEGDIGWEYAANLIRSGFPVIYYAVATGDDILENLFSASNKGYLEDKLLCQVKFIPTIYEDSEGSAIASAIEVAEARGESLVLADFPSANATPDSENYASTLAESVSDSSYAVVVAPAGVYVSPITGHEITMPGSFWLLKTMAEGLSRGIPIWSTHAGAKRGAVTGVKSLSSKVSTQTMKDWTETESIIPLMNIPAYGDLIYGNSTRLHVGTPENPVAVKSALDSLNVRLAANEVKRAIWDICLGLTFDSNDVILWTEFKEKLGPILDGMKAGRGLNDYLIIMDETIVSGDDIDSLTVPGIVKIDFARAAEKFNIVFELTPSGAVFDNI